MLTWNIVKGTAKLPSLCLCWSHHLYKRHCPSEHKSKQKKHRKLTEQLRRKEKLFVTLNNLIVTRWHTHLLVALHYAVPKTRVNSASQKWYLAILFLTKQMSYKCRGCFGFQTIFSQEIPVIIKENKTKSPNIAVSQLLVDSKVGSKVWFGMYDPMPADCLSLPTYPWFSLYHFNHAPSSSWKLGTSRSQNCCH